MTVRRHSVLTLLLLVVALTAAAAAAILILGEIRRSRAQHAVEEAALRADRRIADGRFEEAGDVLHDAAENARSAEQWLTITKRAYRIGEESGDYEAAADLAGRAASRFPQDLNVLSLAAYAAIQAGKPLEALPLLEDAPATERLEALRAHALLAAERRPEERTGPYDLLADLHRESTPGEFEAAYELTGDARHMLDAAVRHAEHGEAEKARSLLETAGLTEDFPEAAGLLAYDLGDYESYEDLLGEASRDVATEPRHLMLQADIAMLRGNFDQAARIYADLRETAPEFSAEQYLNGAWLRRRTPEEAAQILLQRPGRYAGHTGIIQAEVLLRRREEPEQARPLLEDRLERADDPAAIETLAMHLFERRRGSVDSVVSRLWEIVTAYPKSGAPVRYLAWYLASGGDWEELSVLVERKADTAPETVTLYRGLLAARNGDWDGARELFSEEAAGGRWEAAFNAGIAALADNDPAAAHDYFNDALTRLDVEHPAWRSRVLAADALAFAEQGRDREAHERAARAAELDPRNARARYLRSRFAERL
ncbi:MAG: tetratricopeptide repeat protein [Spirochaetaceae bacterium]